MEFDWSRSASENPGGWHLTFESRRGFPSSRQQASLAHANWNFYRAQAPLVGIAKHLCVQTLSHLALFCLPLAVLTSPFKSKSRLEAENLALHKLNVARTGTNHYPTSTCAIGCVVDADLRVFGTEGLCVVDASVILIGHGHCPTR